MANRLSRITTRTGDGGETGLGDGTRTPKDSARVDALGDVDELNSQLGVLLAENLPDDVRMPLLAIQHDLFDIGGELSIPGYVMVGAEHVTRLDELIERYNATLPPLKEFILPGGSRAAAVAHVARTVCRRAERSVVHLGHEAALPPMSLSYLNRLSDLLFVLARVLNRAAGGTDVQWRHDRGRS
jgi:cob(I)alamin adenosyltransferase